MPSAGKRALAALLCLTTLSALSGCMSAELVAGRLTETVLPLPTPTAEAVPTTAPTQSASTSLSTPELSPDRSPAPTLSVEPSGAAPSSATATPTARPGPTPTIPSGEEAMSYFDGLYLNEVDEIAAMREELGVRDDRIDQRPVIQLWCAGDRFGATYPCQRGTFYASYDENLQRTGCFYLPQELYQGYSIGWSAPQEDGTWHFSLEEYPLSKVEADTMRITGFDEEDFGETVELLCTVSATGEMLKQECIAPQGHLGSLFGNILHVKNMEEEWIVVDLRTNTEIDIGKHSLGHMVHIDDDLVVWWVSSVSEGYEVDNILACSTIIGREMWRLQVPFDEDHVGSMEDGTYYITDTYLEEFEYYADHYDAPVYFFRADVDPYLAYEEGEVYAALKRTLNSMAEDGFTFSAPGGYSFHFRTPTSFRAIFHPYSGYLGKNGEYSPYGEFVDVMDYICVLDVEM